MTSGGARPPKKVELGQLEVAADCGIVGKDHSRCTSLAPPQPGDLGHPVPAGQRYRADDRVLDVRCRRIGRDHRELVAQFQVRGPQEVVRHDPVAARPQFGDRLVWTACDELGLDQRIGAAKRDLAIQADQNHIVLPNHRGMALAAGDVQRQLGLLDGLWVCDLDFAPRP